VANAKLSGSTKCAGMQQATVSGDYSASSDAMKSYMRDIVDLVDQYIGNMKDINELTVAQLHPLLLDVELGRVERFQRIGANEGCNKAWQKVLGSLYDQVRDVTDPSAWDLKPSSANWNTCLTHRIGTKLMENKLMHASMIQAIKNSQSQVPGMKTHVARGQVVMVMCRCGLMNASKYSNVELPDWMVNYFKLPVATCEPDLTDVAVHRPKQTFNAAKSSNMDMLHTHHKNKRSQRSVATGTVAGMVYKTVDLSEAQLKMLAVCNRNGLMHVNKTVLEKAGHVQIVVDLDSDSDNEV